MESFLPPALKLHDTSWSPRHSQICKHVKTTVQKTVEWYKVVWEMLRTAWFPEEKITQEAVESYNILNSRHRLNLFLLCVERAWWDVLIENILKKNKHTLDRISEEILLSTKYSMIESAFAIIQLHGHKIGFVLFLILVLSAGKTKENTSSSQEKNNTSTSTSSTQKQSPAQ